jgi:polyferredoxin
MSKRNLRRASQGIFLLLFIFLLLQTESKGNDTLGYPVRLFLDFDPLIFITTFLASHAGKIPFAFFLSVITIITTVLLGRIFCGWICPLGTLHNLAGSLKRRLSSRAPLHWHKVKYYLLIMVVASSLFTLQLAGIVDPISLLIRSSSLSLYPVADAATRTAFDTLYTLDIPGISSASESVYSLLKKWALAFRQPFYHQGVLIGVIFLVILGLNLREQRFWCRYLCPLGALLGILSRYSLITRDVSEGCTSCGLCSSACQGGALSTQGEEWKKSECLACFNCDDICPAQAVHFGFRRAPSSPMDLGRRQVILSFFTGVLAVPLFRATPLSGNDYADPSVIRPPGSLNEEEFLSRCVKCGECMKVCITNGLQPALFESGLEGIWSPRLIPRIGYCEYRCTLCGQVCPSGAIQRLSLEQKTQTKIGLAMIDKGRCLPYAHNTPCIVCEEVCPTPEKAIWLKEAVVHDREGNPVSVKQPHVDLHLCIGCGICEAKCPVGSRPAIYVTSIGESRSESNQLLL